VRERNGVQIKIPDSLIVLAGLQDGTPACLEFSGVHAGAPADVLEVAGTRGVLRMEMLTGRVTLESDGLTQDLIPPPEVIRPWSVESDFLNAVANPDLPRPHPDFEDGFAYMQVIAAVWDRLNFGPRTDVP
jgi:predicted dehydrogenase